MKNTTRSTALFFLSLALLAVTSACSSDSSGTSGNTTKQQKTTQEDGTPDYCAVLTEKFVNDMDLATVREESTAFLYVLNRDKRECSYRSSDATGERVTTVTHYPRIYLFPKFLVPTDWEPLTITENATRQVYTLSLYLPKLSLSEKRAIVTRLRENHENTIAQPSIDTVRPDEFFYQQFRELKGSTFLKLSNQLMVPLKSFNLDDTILRLTFELDPAEAPLSGLQPADWELHLITPVLPTRSTYWIFHNRGIWRREQKLSLLNEMMLKSGPSKFFNTLDEWLTSGDVDGPTAAPMLPVMTQYLDERWASVAKIVNIDAQHSLELKIIQKLELYPWTQNLMVHFDRLSPLFSQSERDRVQIMKSALDLYLGRADTDKINLFLSWHSQINEKILHHISFKDSYWEFLESLKIYSEAQNVNAEDLIPWMTFFLDRNQLRYIDQTEELLGIAHDIYATSMTPGWNADKEKALDLFFTRLNQNGDFRAVESLKELRQELKLLTVDHNISSTTMELLANVTLWLAGWVSPDDSSPILSHFQSYTVAKRWLLTRNISQNDFELMKAHFLKATTNKEFDSAPKAIELAEANLWDHKLPADTLAIIEAASRWLCDPIENIDQMKGPLLGVDASYEKATHYVRSKNLSMDQLNRLKERYIHWRKDQNLPSDKALLNAERELDLSTT